MIHFKIQMTSELQTALDRFMRDRGLTSESEAADLALREALERGLGAKPKVDFRDWIGLGRRVPENPEPRFRSDDDLWG